MKTLKVYKAAAGSGKTFRLAVEYIKLLVEEPMRYRNILAVTFTNKATTEMKLRILSQLYGIGNGLQSSKDYFEAIKKDEHIKKLNLSDDVIREHCRLALEAMMQDYSRFRIETIDSFFQSILRQLAHELGLTNNLRVDLNGDEVLKQGVKELLNSLTESENEALLKAILDIMEERMNENKNWNIYKGLNEFGKNIFKEVFLQNKIHHDTATMPVIQEFKNKMFAEKEKTLQGIKDVANEFLQKCSDRGWDVNCFKGKSGGVWGFFKKSSEGNLPNVTPTVMGCVDDASEWPDKKYPEVQTAAESMFIPMLKEILELRRKLATIVTTLKNMNELMLINDIDEQVRNLNQRENRFLMADTGYLLNALIKDQDIPFLYEKAGIQFSHIMIDEFQDTSSLQWKNFIPLLLNSMALGKECLIVGDVKQSIYRWRNGDWTILNNIEQDEQFSSYVDSEAMDNNYRSTEHVVNFNNLFFEKAADELQKMYQEKTGDTTTMIAQAYASVEQKWQDKYKDMGYVCASFVNADKEDKNGPRLQCIVNHVKDLLAQGVRQKDICILVRKNKFIPDICKALSAQIEGIRVVTDEGFHLDSSPAINLIVKALRRVANPQDRYVLAMLVYQYQKEVLHRDEEDFDPNSIFLLNDDELRGLLPQAFQEEEKKLQMVPLYELAERIYDLLGLKAIEQQDAYLFSFFDQLMTYLEDRPSDLEQFLQYWDDVLHEKSIPVGEADGIRIMTIYKAKGLEFNSVIVAYCDWKFSEQTPLIWCEPKEEPFNEMSLLPISMTQSVKETLFAKDYVGEKLKIYVDNLNVLYVAFTRAKGNLIIVGERTNSKGSAESANYVGEKCLPIDWMNKTDDEYGMYYSIGSIVPSQTEEKKETDEQPNVLTVEPVAQQTKFVTQPMKASFRQSNRATEFAQGNDEQDDNRKRYLNEGVLFHYLLSLLRTPEDLPAAVKRMDFEGYFSNETYRNEVMQLVEKALSTSQAREWFDDHWQVINECTILYRDDQGVVRQRRPDRVVTDGTQTIVIDYKTGRQDNEHIDQVGFYKQKLMEMGYPNVSGYVWYIRRGDIVQVP